MIVPLSSVMRLLWLGMMLLALSLSPATVQAQAPDATESITLPLSRGVDGVQTTLSYSGLITVEVSGSGQMDAAKKADAFYIFTDNAGRPITPYHQYGQYLGSKWHNGGLTINNRPVEDFINPIPHYNPSHSYSFVMTAPGGRLTFGAGDSGTGDNTGAFQLKITPGNQLGARYNISGRITLSNGTALREVELRLSDGQRTYSDASGNYSFAVLPAGSYTLSSSKSGYSFSPASRLISVGPSVSGRIFIGTPTSAGSIGTPTTPSAEPPQKNDETFIGRANGNATFFVTVPVDRYFDETHTNILESDIAIELMVHNPAALAQRAIYLNGSYIGQVDLWPGWGFAQKSKVTTSSALITPSQPGDATLDENNFIVAAQKPNPANNVISIPGEPKVEIAWAAIKVKRALRPIVFVHGWTGNATTFQPFADLARQTGIPYLPPEWMDLHRGVEPDSWTIKRLDTYVEHARIMFGVDKVNLVAHSRGGIISRLAIGGINEGPLFKKVDGLVTISSPHHGLQQSQRGVFFFYWWLRCPLSDSSVPGFAQKCEDVAKSMYPEPMLHKNYGASCQQMRASKRWVTCYEQFSFQKEAAQTINFRALSGSADTDIGRATSTFPWLNSCVTRPQPEGSYLDQTYEYNHVDIVNQQQVYNRLIALLRLDPDDSPLHTSDSCLSPSGVNMQSQALDTSYELLADYSGAVQPSESASHSVGILGSAPVRILFYAERGVDLTLRMPDGELVRPNLLPPDATYEQAEDGELYTAIYTVASPQLGEWQLLVNNGGADEAAYALSVEASSTTRLEVSTGQLAYSVGSSAMLRAWLTESNSISVVGATITATLLGSGAQYRLADDGTQGDITANDGEFTAQLPNFADPGYEEIRVVANWPGGQRERSVVVAVQGKLATIGGVGVEVAASRDASGRWGELSFPISITAQHSGTLNLSGKLLADDGSLVAGASQPVELTSGTQTVTLRFDGRTIHDAGKSGLFRLRDLELEGSLSDALTFDRFANESATQQSYDWREFTGDLISIRVGNSVALDQPGGRYLGQIVVSATVQADFNGTYAWSGSLYTSDGQLVTISDPVTATVTGQTSMPLSFEGADIAASMLNGPYELRNVSVWQIGGTTARYFGDEALHTTAAYRATDFVATAPSGLIIDGPDVVHLGEPATFVASVSPLTATLPLTYSWEAPEQALLTRTGGLSDTSTFSWTTTGTFTITVSVHNTGGVLTTTHGLTVRSEAPSATATSTTTSTATATHTPTSVTPTPTSESPRRAMLPIIISP
jgi:pimeloyl-ACP methyl ester carboxylesterase